MRWQRYLRNLYRNLKKGGSYQSAEKLHHTVQKEGRFNLSLYKIQKWLEGQDTYTLNKEVRRKFKTNYMVLGDIDTIWEADLADMTQYASWNDGARYMLGCIDTFSRKLWIQPLKSKHGAEIVKALQLIMESSGRKPRTIRSDRGSEFVNSTVAAFLQTQGIGQILTSNQSQAAFIERCWKSIKKRIVKYMEDRRTSRYVDVIQDVVKGYNETYHSAIKMAPNEVTRDNDLLVEFNEMTYRKSKESKPLKVKLENEKDPIIPAFPKVRKKKYEFPIDTPVRVTLRRNKIVSEYDERWSKEIFYVESRKIRDGLDVYKIRDEEGEVLIGNFYRQELQRVKPAEKDKLYDIKKIIKSRIVKDKKGVERKEFFVSFIGFPAKFNQWLPESAVKTDQKSVQ